MLPLQRRNASIIAQTLQSVVASLTRLTGHNSLKHVSKREACSLRRLGFVYSVKSGMRPRPNIQKQQTPWMLCGSICRMDKEIHTSVSVSPRANLAFYMRAPA